MIKRGCDPENLLLNDRVFIRYINIEMIKIAHYKAEIIMPLNMFIVYLYYQLNLLKFGYISPISSILNRQEKKLMDK